MSRTTELEHVEGLASASRAWPVDDPGVLLVHAGSRKIVLAPRS